MGAAMDQPAWLAGLFLGYEAIYGAASDLPDGQGGRRQFGNLILSRRPILQAFRHLLPWPADTGVPSMPRGAVEAAIAAPEMPGSALRVVTTHLEYFSPMQRAAQTAALRGLCDSGWRHAMAPRSQQEVDPPFAVLPRGEGCVLCGDFNSPAGAMEHRALQAEGDAPALVDAWALANASRNESGEPSGAVVRAPTFGVFDRRYLAAPACYDFFFVSANIAARVTETFVDAATDASDHQPVLLELA